MGGRQVRRGAGREGVSASHEDTLRCPSASGSGSGSASPQGQAGQQPGDGHVAQACRQWAGKMAASLLPQPMLMSPPHASTASQQHPTAPEGQQYSSTAARALTQQAEGEPRGLSDGVGNAREEQADGARHDICRPGRLVGGWVGGRVGNWQAGRQGGRARWPPVECVGRRAGQQCCGWEGVREAAGMVYTCARALAGREAAIMGGNTHYC